MPPAATHRHRHRVDDLRHQREGADPGILEPAGEGAAVAAGFVALGDDRVDAAFLEAARFRHRRRRAHHQDAGPLERLHRRALGQAEMEADDRRRGRQHGLQHRPVGSAARSPARPAARCRARRSRAPAARAAAPRAPDRCAAADGRRSWRRSPGWCAGARPSISAASPSGVSMPPATKPRPPALATATASSGVDTPAMGAWISGSSMARRSASALVNHRSRHRA